MSVLLETTLGDLVIDLDIENSSLLCKNFLKLVKSRYYTNTLVYNVVPDRYFISGDRRGDGTGGCSIYGYIDAALNPEDDDSIVKSSKRFLKSEGRFLSEEELKTKGVVCMIELGNIKDTIGSQFAISLGEGEDMAFDGLLGGDGKNMLSLGVVTEDDDNVLEKMNSLYCDKSGRPYQDVRIIRALVVYDPFEDPVGLEELLELKNIVEGESSPNHEKPEEEQAEPRISAEDNLEYENEEEKIEELRSKEAKSRAVVLEMLGDLPSADVSAPENVLFVCKLNPVTQDEDLELIFSRFDPNAKAEIIRDQESGQSLNYAFVEFSTKEQCAEAYFKMNNALVDDRRIKVDFSQSVAKVWDRYWQRKRHARNYPLNLKRDAKYRQNIEGRDYATIEQSRPHFNDTSNTSDSSESSTSHCRTHERKRKGHTQRKHHKRKHHHQHRRDRSRKHKHRRRRS